MVTRWRSPTRRRTRAEAFRQPGLAIGIVRPQLLQQQGHVAIRNCKARRIDRSGAVLTRRRSQRRKSGPPSRLQERLGKPLALAIIEPRPAFQSCRNQIDAPQFGFPSKRIGQTKHEKRKLQICGRGAVERSPRRVTCPKGPGDRLRRDTIVRRSPPVHRAPLGRSDDVRCSR
jgi:hypothetical protein